MNAPTALPLRVALCDPSEQDMQIVRGVLGSNFSLLWLTTIRQTIQTFTESALAQRPRILILEMSQHDEAMQTLDPYGGLAIIRTLVTLYPADAAFVAWHQHTFGSAYQVPPIIILTWNQEADAKSAALEGGAATYIVKPQAPDRYAEWMQAFPDQVRRIQFMTRDPFWQSPLLRTADDPATENQRQLEHDQHTADVMRQVYRYRWHRPGE